MKIPKLTQGKLYSATTAHYNCIDGLWLYLGHKEKIRRFVTIDPIVIKTHKFLTPEGKIEWVPDHRIHFFKAI